MSSSHHMTAEEVSAVIENNREDTEDVRVAVLLKRDGQWCMSIGATQSDGEFRRVDCLMPTESMQAMVDILDLSDPAAPPGVEKRIREFKKLFPHDLRKWGQWRMRMGEV